MKWLSPLLLWLVISCRFVSEAAAPRYFTILKSFGFSEQSVAAPSGELCLGSDGKLYGVGEGGLAQTIVHPVIFSVAQDGSDLRILYRGNFGDPGGGLIQATDGRLYGYGASGLYSLRKDGSDFKLWPTPGRWDTSKLLEGSDGLLYATSEGDVFRVRKDGEGFQILREFNDGLNPARRIGNNLLELPGGVLMGTYGAGYGAGYTGGGIYRMNLDGTDYRPIQEFIVSTNGSTQLHSPSTGLKLMDGKLFGAAVNTTNGRPTIFSMRLDGSELILLHALTRDPASELVIGPGQKIRGALGFWGATLFEMDYDGSNYKETAIRRDDTGAPIRPSGTPVVVGDRMYGVARTLDSSWADGFVYEFRPELENPTRVLSRLSYSGGEGWMPNVLLSSKDGNLYGASMRGGAFDNGTIWKVGENGQGSKTLRSFNSVVDGGSPVALIDGADSWLYGIVQGTPYNIDSQYHVEYTPWNGHVFRLSKTGEVFEVLRSHTVEWASALMAGKDGRIYVSVSKRPEATNDSCYIYSMKPDGTDYKEFARFQPDEPPRLGQLLEATDGNFYVTGGPKIFRVSCNGEIQTIHESSYWTPYALMEGRDGGLYGNNNREGFFRINKDGSGYSSQYLSGPLSTVGKQMVEEDTGEFLVVDESRLYRVDEGKEYPQIVRDFVPWQNSWEGEPVYGLVRGGHGDVYGLMKGGGTMGIGAIFRLGDWTVAPRLEITTTNVANFGNLMITTRVSMGTAFSIESAPSAEGPWSNTMFGWILEQPDGAKLWRTATTNELFRARLAEY
jgi:uncharacterized repeat protein (TIGR03803 family)